MKTTIYKLEIRNWKLIQPTPLQLNLFITMWIWIILALAWAAILLAAVSLFRIATYADQKVRRMAERTRQRQDRAA
ncbi:MAG TPA: hypothetical protein VHA33_27010 [Candidatus Angelobacter sp.]|nr:hypothetical protein [Candidatus Angelobacter sp.]